MDNTEQQNYEKSRAEIIKEARESCRKNLSPTSKSNKRSARRSYTYNGLGNSENDETYLNNLRTFFLRIVIAIAILVSVIIISSLDTRYNTNYSDSIETWITSSATIENAEDFFVSFLEKISR